MGEYGSNIELADATRLCRDAGDQVLIFTHAKPDGDAFGSVVALTAALRAQGQSTSTYLIPPVSSNFLELAGNDLVQLYEDGQMLSEPSLVVLLDTGSWSQLGSLRPQIELWTDRMLIIDHHLNGDVPARYRFIDTAAAACSEIVAELIDQMNVAFSATISKAIYIGIASDTGWFRFSNTRPQTHQLAARLLQQGVNHGELYRVLEQTERPEKLALLIRVLSSLTLLAGGRVAMMTIRGTDFEETGATIDETERFVDIPQAVSTVQIVVLITEPPPNAMATMGEAGRAIRLSFRSKPGPPAINVSEIAQRFKGGGHARAAGAKVYASLEQVVQQVTQVLTEVVSQDQSGPP